MKTSSTEFLEAVKELTAAKESFADGQIKPVQFRDLREARLAAALNAMAADLGVKLRQPLHVDSLGEYSIVAIPEDGSLPQYGAGQFGQKFSAALNRHNPRTGERPGAILIPESGWCRLNHFEAEKMVLEYAEQASQLKPVSRVKP